METDILVKLFEIISDIAATVHFDGLEASAIKTMMSANILAYTNTCMLIYTFINIFVCKYLERERWGWEGMGVGWCKDEMI